MMSADTANIAVRAMALRIIVVCLLGQDYELSSRVGGMKVSE
jgi:hypothetical protein